MNTVKDLRQALSEEVERLRSPAGLESRVLSQALHRDPDRPEATRVGPDAADRAALDAAPADPTHRRRVISSLARDRRLISAPSNAWAPALAAILAVAVVVGLVWSNPFRSSPGRPAPTVPLSECQLPVVGIAPFNVGFLDVSSGKVTSARSSVTWFDASRMAPDPNSPAISYDRPAGTFLPVRASWIAADGMSYVDREGYAIHLKSVRSQSDRVFETKRDASATTYPSTDVFLIGWSGGLIYYATRGYGEGADLWALDPTNGRQSQVVPVQSGSEWWYAGPNAIWGSAYYTGRIARYDTKTHAVSSYWVDGLIEIVGLNSAGDPIILSGPRWTPSGDRWSSIGQLARMPANGSATLLGSKTDVFDAENDNLIVVADGDRIWLSTNDLGPWLYSPDTGLELLDKISNRSLPRGLRVAGGCVSREEVRAAVSGAD